MSTLNAFLKGLIAELSADLPEVTEKRMFGSDAFFANDIIYCLVWDGRVVLKFRDAERFEKARALEGADIFDPMGRGSTMTTWVVMPELLADDVDGLRPWVEVAHRDAMSAPPKKAKKKKTTKAPAKKPSARKR